MRAAGQFHQPAMRVENLGMGAQYAEHCFAGAPFMDDPGRPRIECRRLALDAARVGQLRDCDSPRKRVAHSATSE